MAQKLAGHTIVIDNQYLRAEPIAAPLDGSYPGRPCELTVYKPGRRLRHRAHTQGRSRNGPGAGGVVPLVRCRSRVIRPAGRHAPSIREIDLDRTGWLCLKVYTALKGGFSSIASRFAIKDDH